MQTKFEHLNLGKFASLAIKETGSVFGGYMGFVCDTPSGGCECETGGGTYPELGVGYTSDTAQYDSNGTYLGKDTAGRYEL